MRNLKKFLALVLAMMMAFSLMVTANAANEADNGSNQYTDKQTIADEFVEAVDVLYGMGIMTGDYGAFKGDQPIMRSEMATVLYRLMTGDTTQLKSPLYASIATERFSDVNESDWFAPYIGWCYDAGLTVGNNGKFNPWGSVTGYEAEIFVLRAMGYGRNGEYTGANFYVNASYDATRIGLLTDVSKSSFSNTLARAARRDVVASIVFWAAQLPTVTWNGTTYNQYVGVALGTGGNILNPSLGMKNFGLTSHYGIVVGNQATGEEYTKIGFAVNPTVSKGLSLGDELVSGTATVKGTLTAAEITDVIDDNAYYYATDKADAENVTLSFKWDSNLSLFNHKVKVWYDCRGTNGATETVQVNGANYNTSSVAFGTNNVTYALYDKATATVGTAENWALTGTDGDLNKEFKIRDQAFYNYAFAPMTSANKATGSGNSQTLPSVSAKSPIMANNDTNGIGGGYDEWPLYLAIDNDADGAADVIISLDLTISQVVQDNDTQAPLTTGILTQNGTGTGYFDLFDQVNPTLPLGNPADDYSNILNGKMVDSDDVVLRDYVAAVTVTGTTGTNNGISDATATAGGAAAGDATDGNAGATSGFNSTFYYKVNKLNAPQTKTVWKYDQDTQEVFFSDGTSFERSIYAMAVDGSFKENKYVMAPTLYGTYTFYLDEDGDYLFWEEASNSANFVYGTYIDWETVTASSTFIYPMVYVDAQGNFGLKQNITKVDGTAMDITEYNTITLPKRDSATAGNNSGFVKGTYIGYAMSDGVLTSVLSASNNGGTATDRNTGFWQADTSNFGQTARTTIINSTGVNIGAVPVTNATGGSIDGNMNTDYLYLTNTTKFVVVTGAGTANQKATVYNGLKDLLGDSASVEIDASTALTTATLAGPYLDEAAAVPSTSPWDMVYYSLSNETYDQIYDPSAKVIDTVFIPDVMINRTDKVGNGDLYFVGNNAANIINADDDATLYTMYKNGDEQTLWISGQPNGSAGDGINDADIIQELGQNVFYQLVDSGDKAHDGQPIYNLVAMTSTEADDSIIGKYYGSSDTTADQTTVDAASAGQGYLATTRNSQVALIGGNGAPFLYNVATANVKNLYKGYTINSLADLNGQSSLTSNQGVFVSCVLSDTNIVSFIYVNTVQ